MIKLLIDGSEVHLAADISLEFYDRNPFFTSEGQHTLDIDISLADPVNAVVYNAMHRIDVTGRPQNRQALLYCEKGIIIKGTEIILEIDECNAKIQIVSGNSEFNFLVGGDRYLRDLNLGDTGEITLEDAKQSLYSHFPDFDYVCAPVVAKAVISNGVGNELHSSSTIYNQVNEVAKATTVNLKSDTTICPQPYLVAIVARVLKALGYTRTNDAIASDVELSKLIFVHGYKTTKYNEMVENWTVSDFISEVEHLCGVCFIVNNTDKTVEIQTLTNYYKSAVVEQIKREDVIGDINKQYDQDPPDNMVYRNVSYKFPDTNFYKIYALDPDFAKRIEYVYCEPKANTSSDYTRLYNVWCRIIGGEPPKTSSTVTDPPDGVYDSYHSMVAYYDRLPVQIPSSGFMWLPLEFPFIIRTIKSKDPKNGVFNPTRLGMVNQFGPRVDETSTDNMELKIVPIENVFCRYHDYYRYPMPIVENGQGDVGTVNDEDAGKGVVERLFNSTSTPSAKDNMYVGFYMGVSKFECVGETKDDKYPVVPVTINSRLQMLSRPSGQPAQGFNYWELQRVMFFDVDGGYDLSINSDNGMYNTHWQVPLELDLTTIYVINFRSLDRRDARHIFNIAGRKFYCQQLKHKVVGGKLSDVIEGTFYPLKYD